MAFKHFWLSMGACLSLASVFAQPVSFVPMKAHSADEEYSDYSLSLGAATIHLTAKGHLKTDPSKQSMKLPLPLHFLVGAPLLYQTADHSLTIAYQGVAGGDAVGYVCRLKTVPKLKKIWCHNIRPTNMLAAFELDSLWLSSWNSVERRHPQTGRVIWRNLDLSKTVGNERGFNSVCVAGGDKQSVYLQATSSSGHSSGGLGITLDKMSGRMLSNVSQGYNKFCGQ